jgi:hypothetical protein
MPQAQSPLPQEEVPPSPTPVRIVDGFTQYLPQYSRVFFQRSYFAPYPRPLQMGAQTATPRDIPVFSIQAPRNQGIVVREVEWSVLRRSGIGQDEVVAVNPSRVVTYFGLNFSVGNKGIADFNTNVVAPGTPVLFKGIGQGGTLIAPQGAQGTTYPFAGPITPKGDVFYATYAQSNDNIAASVRIMRPPNFEAMYFVVTFKGWLATQNEMDRIVASVTR